MPLKTPAETRPGALGGAQISVRIGEAVEASTSISVLGLLAVGALVSGILLCSAAIVLAANNSGRLSTPKLPGNGS